jgi:hypothetical protein
MMVCRAWEQAPWLFIYMQGKPRPISWLCVVIASYNRDRTGPSRPPGRQWNSQIAYRAYLRGTSANLLVCLSMSLSALMSPCRATTPARGLVFIYPTPRNQETNPHPLPFHRPWPWSRMAQIGQLLVPLPPQRRRPIGHAGTEKNGPSDVRARENRQIPRTLSANGLAYSFFLEWFC